MLAHCISVIIPKNGSKHGRLLKMLIEVDLGKSLLRETKLKLDEELVWVDFRYEQLPAFCFYCGIIGHKEKNCKKTIGFWRA